MDEKENILSQSVQLTKLKKDHVLSVIAKEFSFKLEELENELKQQYTKLDSIKIQLYEYIEGQQKYDYDINSLTENMILIKLRIKDLEDKMNFVREKIGPYLDHLFD